VLQLPPSFFASTQEMLMYTPKIREDLIPRLYRAAKARKIPMTRLVSEIVAVALAHFEREIAAGSTHEFGPPQERPYKERSKDNESRS
jgi:hypothetical protein